MTETWRRVGGAPRASLALGLAFAMAATACSSSGGPGDGGGGSGTGDGGSTDSGTATDGGATSVGAYKLRVHYYRADSAYTGYGIYTWLGTTNAVPSSVADRILFDQTDSWGVYTDLSMSSTAAAFDYIITDASWNKACSSNEVLTLSTLSALTSTGAEIWNIDGDCTIYTSQPTISKVVLTQSKAAWLTSSTLVVPSGSSSYTYTLYYGDGLTTDGDTVSGYTGSAPLTVASTSASSSNLPDAGYGDAGYGTTRAWFGSAYSGYTVLSLDTSALDAGVKEVLKQPMALVATNADGGIISGTGIQTAHVLDDLYSGAASASLGVSFANTYTPTFKLWAPTAQSVTLNVYSSGQATADAGSSDAGSTYSTYAMTEDSATGIWNYTGTEAMYGKYYDYTVKVYAPTTASLVTNTVVDPYAVTLSGNSVHAMVLNLDDAITKPSSWSSQTLTATSAHPTDAVIYELHIRDFSANDATSAHPGKYLAFTDLSSDGMQHLATLAQAGLTHVHLLPSFDFNSVDELACVTPDWTQYASTGSGAAAEAEYAATKDTDCYNWGYDPIHYGAPEGSYATDPDDGITRVVEYRQMIQALHNVGLRVAMDVVYNHTPSSGQDDASGLDKIVPGYYHRLSAKGAALNNSGAGADTATENLMMAKLMVDTLQRWAGDYKIDAFRFDLMGFIPLDVMTAARSAVDATLTTLADGRGKTYFYGEGWSESTSFTQASQLYLADSGIGSFNDRVRDAVRGGAYDTSGSSLLANQGFISGLCYQPNAVTSVDGGSGTSCSATTSSRDVYNRQKYIAASLAGNLSDFALDYSSSGGTVCYSWDSDGGCSPSAGYTAQPQENIAYVSVHDNETLWDISQYKHLSTVSAADRARAQVVGLSIPLLSEGVPFIHAGDDLLRSKSEDSNSYNSGDYFNRIFWDATDNNWAVGLPPQDTGNNATNETQIIDVFALLQYGAEAAAGSSGTIIYDASLAFQDFLKIRKTTPQFRLYTADQVKNCVTFPDLNGRGYLDTTDSDGGTVETTGAIPGLVVMQIGDGTTDCAAGETTDYKSVVTFFNARDTAVSYTVPWYSGRNVLLHPLQKNGSDTTAATATVSSAGVFTIPARTTAVFVEEATTASVGSVTAATLVTVLGSASTTTAMTYVAADLWQASVTLSSGDSISYMVTGTTSGTNKTVSDTYIAGSSGVYVFQYNDTTNTVTITAPVQVLTVPSNVTLKWAANYKLDLSWSASAGATSYTIYKSTDGSAYSEVTTVASSQTSYEDSPSDTTGATIYYYYVVANNASVTPTLISAASSVVSGVPSQYAKNYAAIYLSGGMNSWSLTATPLTLSGDDTWTATVTTGITSGTEYQYKFDIGSWDTSWGAGSVEGTAALGSSTNLSFTATSTSYTFTFDDSTLAYTATAQ